MHRISLLAVLALLAGQPGCTSLINTAVLREAWLDAVDNPFDARSSAGGPSAGGKANDDRKDAAGKTVRSAGKIADGDAAGVDAEGADGGSGRSVDSPEVRQQKLAAALDEAIERLSSVGSLDEAAQAALLSTLESTSPDDWPAVIDAFTSSLAAASPPLKKQPVKTADVKTFSIAEAEPVVQPGGTVSVGGNASAGATILPAGIVSTASSGETGQSGQQPAAVQAGGLIFPVAPASSAVVVASASETLTLLPPGGPGQSLAVGNACFASRVRAWGVVDRFASDRFQPGQDVIVYFELDNLTARESTDGHTTVIDTSLRLVDDGGRLVHEWSFDPIEETCRGRRRDYFARYLVRVPEGTPSGRFRLELAVTDVLAGRTAQTTLAMAVGDEAAAIADGVQPRP